MTRRRPRRLLLGCGAVLLLLLPGAAWALSWRLEVAAARDAIWTALALDSQGRPHISAFDVGNQALVYTRLDGQVWRTEVLDGGLPNSAGSNGSLALDSQDRPHISYKSWSTLRYARWDGVAWRIETVDTQGGGYTSIALDAQGRPHISYCDCPNRTLKYARFDGVAWRIETVGTGTSAAYISLKLDAQGRPHISYSEVQRLRHAFFDGTTWQLETVDDLGSGGVVFSTSLVLDTQDRPRIAYDAGGFVPERLLKYARWDGAGWRIEVAGQSGKDASLGLDAAGRPVISYQDVVVDALKLARFDGLGWQTEIVDSGNVGSYGSLKVDAQDRVHISYNDSARGLKYARGEPRVRLGLQVNQPSFQPGQTLTLTATVTPGPGPETVDAYVGVAVAAGPLLFLQGDGSLSPELRPVVSSWNAVTVSGAELFRYTFSGTEPVGSYTWFGAFTTPGTLTPIEPLVETPFAFGP